MTKKDYQLIASAFFEFSSVALEGIGENIAKALADKLAQENPKFDRSRFMEACGITE
jgi:hypothetical protein